MTLISQDLSEFALHVRAILGLPVGTITSTVRSASAVVLREGHSQDIRYQGIGEALAWCRPVASLWQAGDRRSSSPRVALARGQDCQEAVEQAKTVAAR